MKKTLNYFITIIVFIFIALFPAQQGFAANMNIFLSEIENAVDQAIAAWIGEDAKGLEVALERLTLNETYLLAVGKSGKERSYLALVPESLRDNFNAVAAYLFLIRKEREGVGLWPIIFFEGRRFEFLQQGER